MFKFTEGMCWGVMWIIIASVPNIGAQALDTSCTVAILNRTAKVQSDGTYRIFNVPAGTGNSRVRATCIEDGITRYGQTSFYSINANEGTGIGDIDFQASSSVPTALNLSISNSTLSSAGATAQLTVQAQLPDGSTRNVTLGDSGTTYLSTNPAVATVNENGQVTALSSGRVLLTAAHDAILKTQFITVVLGDDSDGDGIPDDWEITHGLNPNDSLDALLDLDRDGLTNLQEFESGTNPNNPDMDSDGITDGDEVAGAPGFITNPLNPDTDGDGIRDGLEIESGSDPTDPNSTNLALALNRIEVSPFRMTLIINSSIPAEVTGQLQVTGHLRDGLTLDLTSLARGTSYQSSDLTIANFSAEAGRVFAGQAGTAIVTIVNSGFSTQMEVTVEDFAPSPLSVLPIQGFANNLDISNGFAYVAAGGKGLQIVDVSSPTHPVLVGAHTTNGNANDIRVSGNLAFIADGAAGLAIIDVSSAIRPNLKAALSLPGEAWDLVVQESIVFLAGGEAGLLVVDASNPETPVLIGTLALPGIARGVDVSGNLAVVAAGSEGVYVVDISNPNNPILLGFTHTRGSTSVAGDVTLRGNLAFIADASIFPSVLGGVVTIDFQDPSNPKVIGTAPGRFGLTDIALDGDVALASDFLFNNSVLLFDIDDPANVVGRGGLDFTPLFPFIQRVSGNGIKVEKGLAYMTGTHESIENGVSGRTVLQIGRYRTLSDNGTLAPTVEIMTPNDGDTVIQGATIRVVVHAVDEVFVDRVQILVNGDVVHDTTGGPFYFDFFVPDTDSTFTFQANAYDLAGNQGTSPSLTVTAIKDPLTTVAGRVLGEAGNPIANAVVWISQHESVQSGSDGSFLATGVATANGDIIAEACLDSAVVRKCGVSSSRQPVYSGITEMGDIFLRSSGLYEEDLGEILFLGDDETLHVPFSSDFTFPFFGNNYSSLFVNSNGNLTFGQGDVTPEASLGAFLSPLPRIAPMWTDLVPLQGNGGVYVRQLPNRILFTWKEVEHKESDPEFFLDASFQVALYRDGYIEFRYSHVWFFDGFEEELGWAGLAPGTGENRGSQVFFQAPFTVESGAFYQGSGFAPSLRQLTFKPRETGGFDVGFQDYNQPPSVYMESPVTGDSLIAGEIYQVTVAAHDEFSTGGKLSIYVNGSFVGTNGHGIRHSTFNIKIPVGLSTVELEVKATDYRGLESTTGVLSYPVIELPPAHLSILSPLQNEEFREASQITVQFAVDRPAKIELLVNGSLVTPQRLFSDSLTFVIPRQVGAMTLQLRATTGDGKVGFSQERTIQVFSDFPPSVHLVLPSEGETFIAGGRMLLQAEASDDVGVQYVEFRVNGALVLPSPDYSPPYARVFTIPKGPSSLTIQARAVDGLNQGTLSSSKVVNVTPDLLTEVEGYAMTTLGTPAENALIKLGHDTVRTDASGWYSFSGISAARNFLVSAIDSGEALFAVSSLTTPISAGLTLVDTLHLTLPYEGLVAYWPMDGDLTDISPTNHSYYLQGAIPGRDRFGNMDGALYLNGTHDDGGYSNLRHSTFGPEVTYSAWLKAESLERFTAIMGPEFSGTLVLAITIGQNSLPNLVLTQKTGWRLDSPTLLLTEGWYHVAVTLDAERTRIYINGELDIEGPPPVFNSLGNTFYLGRGWNPSWQPSDTMHGILDDMMLYNRALTPDKIKNLYHQGGWSLP